jgi:hypothetical protein
MGQVVGKACRRGDLYAAKQLHCVRHERRQVPAFAAGTFLNLPFPTILWVSATDVRA